MHWETHGMLTSLVITSKMSFNKFIIIGTYLSVYRPNLIINLKSQMLIPTYKQQSK